MAKDILRKEGLSGVYRGLWITVLRDAPAFGVYFSTYEYTREQIHPGCRTSNEEESPATMLVAGGLAGVASWACCYPLDVLKSRLQAQIKPQSNQLHSSNKYQGILDCLRKSVHDEGLGVFIVNGATFCAYELALRFLVNGNQSLMLEES